jgi:hypothetical protein
MTTCASPRHHLFRPSQVARPHAVTQAHPVTDLEAAELLPILLAAPLMDGLGQSLEVPIHVTSSAHRARLD